MLAPRQPLRMMERNVPVQSQLTSSRVAIAKFLAAGKVEAHARCQSQPILKLDHHTLSTATNHPEAVRRDHLEHGAVLSQVLSCDLFLLGTKLLPQFQALRGLRNVPRRVQVSENVIVLRHGEYLVAVDQHAADERVRLERLQASLAASLSGRFSSNAHKVQQNGRQHTAKLVKEASNPTLGHKALPEAVQLHLTWHQHAVLAEHKVRTPRRFPVARLSHGAAPALELPPRSCQITVST